MDRTDGGLRLLALFGVAASTIFAGAFIGATTNAINGAVSPTYFVNVLGWTDVENVWRASIAQGVFEGLLYGVVLSLAFTFVVGIVSRVRAPYGFALRHILAMVCGVYVCWALGGVLATGLAALSPDFYRETFLGVPEERGEMLRYAWVGGSIWGAMSGGPLAVVVGSVVFAARWNRCRAMSRA